MKIKMKYLVIVFLLIMVGSHAVASPLLAEARDVMLKCALTEVKPQIIYRAYDKIGNTTRKSRKVNKNESLEDALVRSNLGLHRQNDRFNADVQKTRPVASFCLLTEKPIFGSAFLYWRTLCSFNDIGAEFVDTVPI